MRAVTAALLLIFVCHTQAAETLRIAVASNFKPTLEALLPVWQAQSDIAISLSSGPSGALTQQILAGAPFGLFLSADADFPQLLFNQGKSAQPQVYARGQLILACNQNVQSSTQALQQANTLALANTRTAPYGRAAIIWLSEHGQGISAKQVQAGSVAGALQFVVTGNADCALVAASFTELAPQLYWYSLPHAAVLTQAASVIDNSSAASLFLTFLLSDTAQQLIQQNGYLTAKP
ncbi:molybdate ABC transporter substrate-binding protein [Gilvimarinus polysaccharolyticus]|uniref:molybdate ABC transporter substrate-binding protein n=1 Tax=Gilvimarinus polysaccharolyticus TaxID=863921 RepID=UPI0006731B68|nr:molybdate ABC transporter substrate-binding protein [Gilvimarinus polysaccharolyticus]